MRRAIYQAMSPAARGVLLAGAMLASAAVHAANERCHPGESTPHLRIETKLGVIEVELFADAAPSAVAQLVALVAGSESEGGYYDGLAFDYTQPHMEIRTAERIPTVVEFDTEIDAQALGLHEQGPRDAGEAMAVMQEELLVAFRKDKRGNDFSPLLQQWLQTWYERRDAGFLVNVSRQQINEALGFAYTESLASKPVSKGSVALVPRSKTVASPRLSIALRDLPLRTGKWMVVGQVVSGLDLADRISIAPLDQPRNVKPRGYVPQAPVVIESALLCR